LHTTTHHTKSLDQKTFYICVGILAFAIVALQPLSMLLVIFTQALTQ
jgi:hypothetical protein